VIIEAMHDPKQSPAMREALIEESAKRIKTMPSGLDKGKNLCDISTQELTRTYQFCKKNNRFEDLQLAIYFECQRRGVV
jgi:hypothetical protein